MNQDRIGSDAPLDSLELMKVVMQADEETRAFALRGTTNWAVYIGKVVQRAVIAATPSADNAQQKAGEVMATEVNDHELLELAAKACGWAVVPRGQPQPMRGWRASHE